MCAKQVPKRNNILKDKGPVKLNIQQTLNFLKSKGQINIKVSQFNQLKFRTVPIHLKVKFSTLLTQWTHNLTKEKRKKKKNAQNMKGKQ